MRKALGKNVIVEQVLEKKSKLFMSPNEAPDNEDVYTITSSKVIKVSEPLAKEGVIAKGDIPYFDKYAEPRNLKTIEGKPGDEKIVRLAVFSRDNIVAID